ncbi:MAG: phage virion morphogenesis protein [Oceanococcaceae bacterium]
MSSLAFEIEGDDEIIRRLNKLLGRVETIQTVLAEAGNRIVDNIRLTFTDSESPYGVAWAPLSPVTIAKPVIPGGATLRGDGQPLLNTGTLRDSIALATVGNAVEIGTNDPRAPTHQFGARQGEYGRSSRNGPIPWGDVPARPFLPIRGGSVDLPDDWQGDVLDALESALGEVLR